MKKYLPIILLFGGVLLFAFGLVELFKLRFERGDVYPPYSSLRADPLGTMVFYESLEKISGLSVRRDVTDSDRLPSTPHTVYLQFAGAPYDWERLPAESFREVENFLARGDRLVVAFSPELSTWDADNAVGTNSVVTNSPPKPSAKPVEKKHPTDAEESRIDLTQRWGWATSFQKLPPGNAAYAAVTVEKKTDLPLPPHLDWHSGLIFIRLNPAWRTIYARGTNAVVIERAFGKGSVVLATDAYFVSNEAMAKDRHADLLAWLVGVNDQVVFDESHFGIVETSGVAILIRQYRLHGVVAGLLLLAGLFIWKNSTSLVPPRPDEREADFVTGKGAASGFVNLLRRSLAPRDLLAACFAEWEKSVPAKTPSIRRQQAEAIFQAENTLPNQERDPVAAYKKISDALTHHKL